MAYWSITRQITGENTQSFTYMYRYTHTHTHTHTHTYLVGVYQSIVVNEKSQLSSVPMAFNAWSLTVMTMGHVILASALVIPHGPAKLVNISIVLKPVAITVATVVKVQINL